MRVIGIIRTESTVRDAFAPATIAPQSRLIKYEEFSGKNAVKFIIEKIKEGQGFTGTVLTREPGVERVLDVILANVGKLKDHPAYASDDRDIVMLAYKNFLRVLNTALKRGYSGKPEVNMSEYTYKVVYAVPFGEVVFYSRVKVPGVDEVVSSAIIDFAVGIQAIGSNRYRNVVIPVVVIVKVSKTGKIKDVVFATSTPMEILVLNYMRGSKFNQNDVVSVLEWFTRNYISSPKSVINPAEFVKVHVTGKAGGVFGFNVPLNGVYISASGKHAGMFQARFSFKVGNNGQIVSNVSGKYMGDAGLKVVNYQLDTVRAKICVDTFSLGSVSYAMFSVTGSKSIVSFVVEENFLDQAMLGSLIASIEKLTGSVRILQGCEKDILSSAQNDVMSKVTMDKLMSVISKSTTTSLEIKKDGYITIKAVGVGQFPKMLIVPMGYYVSTAMAKKKDGSTQEKGIIVVKNYAGGYVILPAVLR